MTPTMVTISGDNAVAMGDNRIYSQLLYIWFVVWNMNGLLFYILRITIPTDDSSYFQRGRAQPPDSEGSEYEGFPQIASFMGSILVNGTPHE